MRAQNEIRQFSSLLNEHWKRKQRLKQEEEEEESDKVEEESREKMLLSPASSNENNNNNNNNLSSKSLKIISSSRNKNERKKRLIDVFRPKQKLYLPCSTMNVFIAKVESGDLKDQTLEGAEAVTKRRRRRRRISNEQVGSHGEINSATCFDVRTIMINETKKNAPTRLFDDVEKKKKKKNVVTIIESSGYGRGSSCSSGKVYFQNENQKRITRAKVLTSNKFARLLITFTPPQQLLTKTTPTIAATISRKNAQMPNGKATLLSILLTLQLIACFVLAMGQSMLIHSDPRPTIYSGQVSFGLLLSAHSSIGSEMSTSASHQVNSMLLAPQRTTTTFSSSFDKTTPSSSFEAPTTATTTLADDDDDASRDFGDLPQFSSLSSITTSTTTTTNRHGNVNFNSPSITIAGNQQQQASNLQQTLPPSSLLSTTTRTNDNNKSTTSAMNNNNNTPTTIPLSAATTSTLSLPASSNGKTISNNLTSMYKVQPLVDIMLESETKKPPTTRHHEKRQIFERQKHRNQYRRQQGTNNNNNNNAKADSSLRSGICSQVNPNALYAGMSAIWASHQANLVGDSNLGIGTYVYDSCNDLEVGQRQSVRIVSNLNAFQQTTCESPRGSPISLTIAHGENQLRAIQLLTSFKVPVITTKEHFALEDYNQLTDEQKQFLFSTSPSSRHLANGALQFTKIIVTRITSSPKLANQYHRSSPKNGLIVISRNLPARFITYLVESIPRKFNYEMLQSSQPIDQIKSVEMLESILIKNKNDQSDSASSSSESRINNVHLKSPLVDLALKLNNNYKEGTGNLMENVRIRRKRRTKRWNFNDDSDSNESDSMNGNSNGDSDESNSKMLSPTILMFITASEAIDLVTRLRNDLAEVSKYYSLIVTTREDISPALKTIFQSGGSRLCSGKAFYTISPKPDDIGEFRHYFRDTVQMEGENSDHPLICEYAKYQSTTRDYNDLDDISTEPVIKAVWSAAAVFKSVHRNVCNSQQLSGGGGGAASSSSSTSSSPNQLNFNVYRAGDQSDGNNNNNNNQRTGRQSMAAGAGSSKSECMVKMNKNMSLLVQKALKSINATIDSTGLQSLDGFRIKFDDSNELLSNKFSIKYINKECEMTELGQYSGFKNSLKIDDDILMKSVESTLPDPWPITITPPSTPAPIVNPSSTLASSSTNGQRASSSATTTTPGNDPSAGDGSSNGNSDSSNSDSTSPSSDNNSSSSSSSSSNNGSEMMPKSRGRRKHKLPNINREVESNDDNKGEEEDNDDRGGGGGGGLGDKSSEASDEVPKRMQNKRSRTSGSELSSNDRSKKSLNNNSDNKRSRQFGTSPITAMGGRDILPGLTDTSEITSSDDINDYSTTPTTSLSNDRTASSSIHKGRHSGYHLNNNNHSTITKQMRKLKPFPKNLTGTTIRDWLPTTPNSIQSSSINHLLSPEGKLNLFTSSLTTRSPNLLTGSIQHEPPTTSNGRKLLYTDNEQVDPAQQTTGINSNSNSNINTENKNTITNTNGGDDLRMRATTLAPVYSTLPESGGNADLEPTVRVPKSIINQNSTTTMSKQTLDTSATTENSDYVTSPSISKNSIINHSADIMDTDALQQKQHQQQSLGRLGFNIYTRQPLNLSRGDQQGPMFFSDKTNQNYFKDLYTSPIPLSSITKGSYQGQATDSGGNPTPLSIEQQQQQQQSYATRSRLRSHLRWIYSSWFTLSILCANICGAIATLYVLTFLLMKNCDGSLDRENQGLRSLHLLAIIIVFFGSTLFIVYPTPALCLLRTSWHNFALVMLFGTLLLQTMQIRALKSIGLGGRPNRLNQFLTLLFIVGVQVSFELQRWKYESSSYLNFVNQHFTSTTPASASASAATQSIPSTNPLVDINLEDKKLLLLSSSLANQLNPFNSFNDQTMPVSIQVSEQYQNLLQDYCMQQTDDFLQSQIYLCCIVFLLIVFSATTKNFKYNHTSHHSNHHKLNSLPLSSGKLVASEHEANLSPLSTSHHHHFAAASYSTTKSIPTNSINMSSSKKNGTTTTTTIGNHLMVIDNNKLESGNIFSVTLVIAPIYTISIIFHLYGQSVTNRDLISSITMVLIAFATLIGIFLPILRSIHRRNSSNILNSNNTLTTTTGATNRHPSMGGILNNDINNNSSRLRDCDTPTNRRSSLLNQLKASNSLSNKGFKHGSNRQLQQQQQLDGAFAMFPEFAPTGLRRPSSGSGDSSSGSRKPFAHTKESRRNMSIALANLGPSEDSLRSMGFYNNNNNNNSSQHHHHNNKTTDNKPTIDPALLNLKLNLSANEDDETIDLPDNNYSHHHNHSQQGAVKNRKSNKGEKRLIMLDVDPCCPRHGIGASTSR